MDNNNNGFYNPNENNNQANQFANNTNPYATNQYSANTSPVNPYAAQNAYASAAVPPKAKKEKKKGMGSLIGKAVVAALVFSLVAAPAFTAINYGMNKALGVNTSSSTNKSSTSKSNSSSNNAEITQDKTDKTTPIPSTDTSKEAADLTDVSSIVSEVMPSIVSITNVGTTSYESYWGTQSYESTSCGSGIIIAQDDNYIYIVTNNHVVENAKTLTVQFSDESTVEAEIKGTEASDDLAVVRVARTNIEATTLQTIRVASVADSSTLSVGSASIAIGNALGYGQSVTTGVISALNRSVTVSDNGSTIIHNNLIQTDAAINPGNSGGALLNAKGEVIGINSVKYTDTDVEGIGYAIPISDAMKVVERLISREKVDEADAAYLGIQGRDITSSMASAYDWPLGIYVVDAISGKAAAKAGIQSRDIITAIGEVKVTTMSELKNELSYYKAGETVTVTVERAKGSDFETVEIEVTLGSAAEESSSRNNK